MTTHTYTQVEALADVKENLIRNVNEEIRKNGNPYETGWLFDKLNSSPKKDLIRHGKSIIARKICDDLETFFNKDHPGHLEIIKPKKRKR